MCKNQFVPSKKIEFSNSFDALSNEHERVMNEEGKSVQQVVCDIVSKTGQSSTPGSGK